MRLCAEQDPVGRHETVDRCRHGRQEHRRVEVFEVTGRLPPDWQGPVACAARLVRLTWCRDTRTGLWCARRDVAYYVSQIRLDAASFGRAVRAHWGIENRAHHVRDATLGEDGSRIRNRPDVMARIRSVALNILRANGVQNIRQALYANALNFDRLLALGTS